MIRDQALHSVATQSVTDTASGDFAQDSRMNIRMSAQNLAQYPPWRLIELARLQEACGYETFWYTDERFIASNGPMGLALTGEIAAGAVM